MGKQQAFGKAGAIFTFGHHRQRHPGQRLQGGLVFRLQGKGHQTGTGRQYLESELFRQLVAKGRGPNLGHRQAAAGHHQ